MHDLSLQKWPDWKGEVVVVVATGPTAEEVPLDVARGAARIIAVKDAWSLCPWADVLYACDHHWWEAHNGVLDYGGQRIAFDMRTVERFSSAVCTKGFPDFLRVSILKRPQLLMEKTGVIGWGGNSGFHAINLAAQFGARKIVLVGFDMRIDYGKHFFGNHPYPGGPSKSNCVKWAKTLDDQAEHFADYGIEVINCSEVSALTAYPKMSLERALS